MDLGYLFHALKKRLKGNFIAVYGVGSYFDPALPEGWHRGDIDIIAVVNSLEGIPKKDWTKVRFWRKKLEGKDFLRIAL